MNFLAKPSDINAQQRLILNWQKSITLYLRNKISGYQQPSLLQGSMLRTSEVHKKIETFWKVNKKRGSYRTHPHRTFWKFCKPPGCCSCSRRKLHTFICHTSRSLRRSLITLTYILLMAIANSVVHDFTPSCWWLTFHPSISSCN